MTTLEVPSPVEAQAVAERFVRSVETWRELPAIFDRAVTGALGVVTAGWTQAKARELQSHLNTVLAAQLAVLDNFTESAAAVTVLAARAQDWAQARQTAADVQSVAGTEGPLRATVSWRSDAGRGYAALAGAQANAAGQTASTAEDIGTTLGSLAVAGTGFTIATTLVIEKTTAELTDYADAVATGVGTLRSLGEALREAATAGEFITGAAGHLIDAVQSNAAKLTTLEQGIPSGM